MASVSNEYRSQSRRTSHSGTPSVSVPSRTGGAKQRSAVLEGDLKGADLKFQNLRGVDLSGRDLSGADLSGADLTGANLSIACLRGAQLFEATLDDAELLGADLREAYLEHCKARRAGFGGADLSESCLLNADLTEATLSNAKLCGADFRGANVSHARMRNAVLDDAEFSRANLQHVDLEDSSVHRARFWDTNVRAARLKGLVGYDSATWVRSDIRDVDFCGAYLVRRHIMDENYLHEFRRRNRASEWLYRVWWLTSDCGRSFGRWALWVGLVAVTYAALFSWVVIDYGSHETVLSPFYFSLVTLTTLGYGDVLPASTAAQALVMSEVVIGYVGLGGLLSIFANKMARRAE